MVLVLDHQGLVIIIFYIQVACLDRPILFVVEHVVHVLHQVFLKLDRSCSVQGSFQVWPQSVTLWMSSGGTMSVLHNDDGENFLMLLDGTKSVPCFEQRAWNWNAWAMPRDISKRTSAQIDSNSSTSSQT